MNWRRTNPSYLAPPDPFQGRVPSGRRSSASFTDSTSNMQRDPSHSSHMTESSQTANSIHSNIGESIGSINTGTSPHISDGHFWGRSHILGEDQNAFAAINHSLSLVPPAISLPQTPIEANDSLLNLSNNDAKELFEFAIGRLHQEFNRRPDQIAYALSFAQACLDPGSIRNFLSSREHDSRLTPQPQTRHKSISNSTNKSKFACFLCETPVSFSSAGSFKRHVNDTHHPKSTFLCMHCKYQNTRKDKLRDHIRVRHFDVGSQSSYDLKDRELLLEPPSSCELCEILSYVEHIPPFLSWDSWFQGIKSHCLIEDREGSSSEKKFDSSGQNDGDAGGAAGGYSSNLMSMQGQNMGGGSSLFPGNWTSRSSFSEWGYSPQTMSGSQMLCQNAYETPRVSNFDPCSHNSLTNYISRSHPKAHSEGTYASLPQQLTTIQIKNLPYKNGSQSITSLSKDISKEMSKLSLDDEKDKIVLRKLVTQSLVSSQKSQNSTTESILKTSLLLSNIIQEFDIAALIFSINRISLHLDGKLQVTESRDHAKIALDPLVVGQKTLYRIHRDYPNSYQILSHQLSRCYTSLNAIQSELSGPSLPSHAISLQQKCRRKRLSSLWARLRAVTFVLSLQKEVEEEGISKVLPSPSVNTQLGLNKHGRKAMSSFTTQALRSMCTLAQKHLYGYQEFDFLTRSITPTAHLARFKYSLGISGVLQALTVSISTPEESHVEHCDTTDLYGLLHSPTANIHTTVF